MVSMKRKLHLNIATLVIAACLATGLSSCRPVAAPPAATVPIPSETAQAAATLPAPQVGITSQPSPTESPLPTQTPSPSITPTPDPYGLYTIDYLVGRAYGGGELRIEETLATNSYFTRTLIAYPSDNLTIYGFMNTPRRVPDEERLPVIIALHGYIEPSIYATLDYTTHYADALAREGFLVIHPNLRGYAPSDDGDNLFRVGMAIDVLNLIALVKQGAGKTGPLERADPEAIGVWGHSMGGGITTRVITVNPDVRAAVLYGAMSGDERLNYERIFNYFSDGTRGLEELSAPEQALLRISPVYAMERIQAAVSIHHGEHDTEVPLSWSQDTCQRLEDLGKDVECFIYNGQPHTFQGEGDDLFIQRMIAFFTEWLR